MNTPDTNPAPQWAVEAAKETLLKINPCDERYGGPSKTKLFEPVVAFVATIIARHAPEEQWRMSSVCREKDTQPEPRRGTTTNIEHLHKLAKWMADNPGTVPIDSEHVRNAIACLQTQPAPLEEVRDPRQDARG